ncbi:MAG: hypothetical protein RLW42_05685, partial [Gammaproteobacteria bacterium]
MPARHALSRPVRAVRLLLSLGVLALSAPAPAPADALPAELSRVMARHKLSTDAVSFVVQAVDEPTPRLA